MTVEIVVNGYYRSGTTLVWNLMKEGIKNHVSSDANTFEDEGLSLQIRRVSK